MPIIKSAKKRMRQTIKSRARNQNTKRSLRVELKNFAAAVAEKDTTKVGVALKAAQSNIDKAVKKNILKKNTAARKLSKLSEQAKSVGYKPTATTKKPAAAKAVTKKPVVKKAAPAKTVAKKPAVKKTATKK